MVYKLPNVNRCELCKKPTKTQRMDKLPRRCIACKRVGVFHSLETRARIAQSQRVYYEEHPEAREFAANLLRAMRNWGAKCSPETRRKLSAASKRHCEQNIECGCWVHKPYLHRGDISPLQWRMLDFLAASGFRVIVPETRLGRFSVDAVLGDEWVGFEADGRGWHQDKGRDLRRDQEIYRRWGLPIVRLSQEDINELLSS